MLWVVMRSQMTQSFMQLVHENVVVSDSEISMRVTTELVVSKDLLSNATHHPFSLIHWAHTVSISIEHCNWSLLNVL